MKRILVLGLGSLTLLLAACGGGAPNDLAQQSAKQVLAAALAAAKKSGSFHYQLIATSGGKTQSITGDASAAEGRQILSSGTGNIEAEAIGHTVYIEGDSGGLQAEMSFSAAKAATYAGRWISLVTTDAPYASVVKAVTLASALSQIEPTGHLTLTATTTRDGQPVIGVRSPLPGPASSAVTGSVVLYVSTAGPALPVAFEGRATNSGKAESDTGRFSRWGKPVDLVAPADAVAYATLSTSG